MEQDPATWIAALEATVTDVLDKLGARRSEVRGIGVSGQQHGFVPLDCGRARSSARPSSGATPPPRKSATSSAPISAARRELIAQVGLDMLPGFTAPKILWLKRHEPENFARLRHGAVAARLPEFLPDRQADAWSTATRRAPR